MKIVTENVQNSTKKPRGIFFATKSKPEGLTKKLHRKKKHSFPNSDENLHHLTKSILSGRDCSQLTSERPRDIQLTSPPHVHKRRLAKGTTYV